MCVCVCVLSRYLLKTAYCWILLCDNLCTLIRERNLFTVNMISHIFLIIIMYCAFSKHFFSPFCLPFCWLNIFNIHFLPTHNSECIYSIPVGYLRNCNVHSPLAKHNQSLCPLAILKKNLKKHTPLLTHNCHVFTFYYIINYYCDFLQLIFI